MRKGPSRVHRSYYLVTDLPFWATPESLVYIENTLYPRASDSNFRSWGTLSGTFRIFL